VKDVLVVLGAFVGAVAAAGGVWFAGAAVVVAFVTWPGLLLVAGAAVLAGARELASPGGEAAVGLSKEP
jgi:hypothetical protein